jgi:L-ascorbate metabolism protein UlaG (beta-lactamase superfamily)
MDLVVKVVIDEEVRREPPPTKPGSLRASLLVALVSASLMILEIVHHQLLTFFAGYGLAQVAVNTALIGLGVGGLTTLLIPPKKRDVWLTALPILAAASLWMGVWYLATSRFDLLTSSLLLALPYVAISMVMSLTYISFPSHSVYSSSLLGAALGVLGVGSLYNLLGAEWMILLVTLFLICGSTLWAGESGIQRIKGWLGLFAVLIAACLLVQPLRSVVDFARWSAVASSPGSSETHDLFRNYWFRIDHSKWNLDGRLDIVALDKERSIWTTCLNAIPVDSILRFRVQDSVIDPRFPLLPPVDSNALIFGLSAQGVSQVVRDMVRGEVVGIELNSSVVEAMQGPFYEKSAQAYRGIDVRVMDGRSFIDQDQKKYGLITLMFTHPIKLPMGVPEYLYTREAFGKYFDHLSESGHINVEEKFRPDQWERSLGFLRVLESIRSALQSKGVSNPDRHLIVISWDFNGYRFYHTLVGQRPFTQVDLAVVRDRMARGDPMAPRFRRLVFDPLQPGPGVQATLERDFESFLEPGSFRSHFANRIASGTADARPYLHPATQDMPREWYLFEQAMWMVIPLALLALLGTLRAHPGQRLDALRSLLGLALLGSAYLLVEFHLIQSFQLFLGSYTTAFVVVLGLLFVFGGVGSIVAQRLPPRRTRRIPFFLVGALLAFDLVSPPVLEGAMGAPLGGKLLLALLLVGPLGLMMGMPFPLAMEVAKDRFQPRFAAYALAANGALSVAGSALHLLIAVQFTASTVFLVAVGIYVAALLLLFGSRLGAATSCVVLLGLAAFLSLPAPQKQPTQGPVSLEFLGHACFRIDSPEGFTLLMDPYPSSIGLAPPAVSNHVVTSSHPHADHSFLDAGSNHSVILKGIHPEPDGKLVRHVPLKAKVYDFSITSLPSSHNTTETPQAGPNSIFLIETGGLRIVHLGDLGHTPAPEVLQTLEPVDVLLLPVGGIVTLDLEEAHNLIERLKPRLVIPMHYRVPGLIYPLGHLDSFLDGRYPVRHLRESQLALTRSSLPKQTEVLVMDMARLHLEPNTEGPPSP